MPVSRMQQRRDTSARWATVNPVLLDGELGYDTIVDRYKVGNGVDVWTVLPWSDRLEDTQAAATQAQAAAVASQAAAADAVDISNIDTSDDVVQALVAGTAGAGPRTREALSVFTYDDRASRSLRSRIAGVGDSISDNTWEPFLADLLDGVAVFDLGFSGEESSRIAFRHGAVTYTSTGAVTIPGTTTPVDIPVAASVAPHRIAGHGSNVSAPAIFAGVAGLVTSQGSDETPWGPQDAAAGTGTVRFTRTTAGASVSAPAGTVMSGTDGDTHRGDTTVFWTGQNDGAFAGELAPTLVVTNTQAMIDHLSPDVADFIVLTVTTGSTLSLRSAFMAINAAHGQASYASHLRDIRRHLIDNGLSILGITPTTADTAAIANDIIPPSLLIDGVHPTPACQEQVVAPFIRDALASRGRGVAAYPEWEVLTLTNGSTAGALKTSTNNGIAYLRGHVEDGTLTEGTTLAILPKPYRPAEDVNLPCVWKGPGFDWYAMNISILPGGAVIVGHGFEDGLPITFPIELSWPLW